MFSTEASHDYGQSRLEETSAKSNVLTVGNYLSVRRRNLARAGGTLKLRGILQIPRGLSMSTKSNPRDGGHWNTRIAPGLISGDQLGNGEPLSRAKTWQVERFARTPSPYSSL